MIIKKWKNVVSFEIYQDNILSRAAIYGSGSQDNSFSRIILPSEKSQLYAVGWDRQKKLVYPVDLEESKDIISKAYPNPFKDVLSMKLLSDKKNKKTTTVSH